MTQQELNRQIALSTGESIQQIEAMGFGVLTPTMPIEERAPLVVDWDLLEQTRYLEQRKP